MCQKDVMGDQVDVESTQVPVSQMASKWSMARQEDEPWASRAAASASSQSRIHSSSPPQDQAKASVVCWSPLLLRRLCQDLAVALLDPYSRSFLADEAQPQAILLETLQEESPSLVWMTPAIFVPFLSLQPFVCRCRPVE